MKTSGLDHRFGQSDLSFPNVSIGNPVMCYSEHRFRLIDCRNDGRGNSSLRRNDGRGIPDKLVLECFYRGSNRNDIVLVETMIKTKLRHAGLDPASSFFMDSRLRRNDVLLGYFIARLIKKIPVTF